MRIITGFHAIEEELRVLESNLEGKNSKGKKTPLPEGLKILYAKPGPRVKKILELAGKLGIAAEETDPKKLDALASALPPLARDHRGIVFQMAHADEKAPLRLEDAIKQLAVKEKAIVIILDSITDPHNTGAIIRSADQFGVDLVIIPEHRSATDFEVIARTSAGASAWVPIVLATNLVRAAEQLKEASFWLYGADAGGTPLGQLAFADKAAVVMGSEGKGIAQLLSKKCDAIVSIPTRGRLDSLNVSVAAGVILYEITRK